MLFLLALQSHATIDIGVGSSSVTGGRSAPAIALGFRFGGSYILRTYWESLTAEIETSKKYAIGPALIAKFQLGPLYLGFDTVLGLNKQFFQHLVLNFQDVSHVTIGVSF